MTGTNQLPTMPTPKFTETIRGVPCITVTEHEHLMRAYALQARAQVQGEPVLTIEKEPDYWSGGHFHKGSRPHINPMKVWHMPIGTKLYTHPAPSVPATTEPVAWNEREQLRHAQAAVVMPMIGPLLDAWENSDREVMSQEPELSKQLKNINSAMEDAQPATSEPVLFIHPDTFAMNNAQVGAWKPGYELTSYIPLYTHPAPSAPGDVVRDAERYEWLRQHQLLAKINYMPTPSGEDLDAAIDAAMLAAKDSK